jgi:hypothetical protein
MKEGVCDYCQESFDDCRCPFGDLRRTNAAVEKARDQEREDVLDYLMDGVKFGEHEALDKAFDDIVQGKHRLWAQRRRVLRINKWRVCEHGKRAGECEQCGPVLHCYSCNKKHRFDELCEDLK